MSYATLRRHFGMSLLAVCILFIYSTPPAKGQIDAQSPLILRPTADQSGFGSGLSMGDVNGDGDSDVIVGSVLSTVDGMKDAGRVFLFFGGAQPSTSPDLVLEAPSPEQGARFGWAIAVGDVNRDGFNDIIVSALFANGGTRDGTGAVYVFFGGPSLDSQADVTLASPQPLAARSHFGFALTTGDFNGDGIDDVAVGADNVLLDDSAQAGEVFVFFGRRFFGGGLSLPLRSPRVERAGEFGSSLVAADLNADGFVDLAVGAPGQTAGETAESGQVHIFLGGPSFNQTNVRTLEQSSPARLARFGIALAAGDTDGDSRQDLIVGATNPPAIPFGPQNRGEIYVFSGGASIGQTPPFVFDQASVTGLGNPVAAADINRDAFSDIVAGVPATSVGRRRAAGQALIFLGNRQLSGLADITLQSTSPTGNELFGATLATGDFNADGLTDLAVGAIFATLGGGGGAGKAFVFLGQ